MSDDYDVLRLAENTDDVNRDRYVAWRNDNKVGYVHLGFAVIIAAIHDLYNGTPQQMLSASLFFFGDSDVSFYKVWLEVIGVDDTSYFDSVLEYSREGIRPPKEWFSEIDRMFRNVMYGM